jgi:hypothetical protein
MGITRLGVCRRKRVVAASVVAASVVAASVAATVVVVAAVVVVVAAAVVVVQIGRATRRLLRDGRFYHGALPRRRRRNLGLGERVGQMLGLGRVPFGHCGCIRLHGRPRVLQWALGSHTKIVDACSEVRLRLRKRILLRLLVTVDGMMLILVLSRRIRLWLASVVSRLIVLVIVVTVVVVSFVVVTSVVVITLVVSLVIVSLVVALIVVLVIVALVVVLLGGRWGVSLLVMLLGRRSMLRRRSVTLGAALGRWWLLVVSMSVILRWWGSILVALVVVLVIPLSPSVLVVALVIALVVSSSVLIVALIVPLIIALIVVLLLWRRLHGLGGRLELLGRFVSLTRPRASVGLRSGKSARSRRSRRSKPLGRPRSTASRHAIRPAVVHAGLVVLLNRGHGGVSRPIATFQPVFGR